MKTVSQTLFNFQAILTNRLANFRWCGSCESGQIHESAVEGDVFTCISCGYRTCINHANTLHESFSCQQYGTRLSRQRKRDERVQEAVDREAINAFAKKCPRQQCSYYIEKSGGCDHITCKDIGDRARKWRLTIIQVLIAIMSFAGAVCAVSKCPHSE